jgi:hypothetical protein
MATATIEDHLDGVATTSSAQDDTNNRTSATDTTTYASSSTQTDISLLFDESSLRPMNGDETDLISAMIDNLSCNSPEISPEAKTQATFETWLHVIGITGACAAVIAVSLTNYMNS